MSYCRFRNTLLDLIDCKDAIDGGDINNLGREEKNAFVDLIMLCKEISDGFEDFEYEAELHDYINEMQGDGGEEEVDEDGRTETWYRENGY